MEFVVVGAVLTAFLPKLWDMIKDGHGQNRDIKEDIVAIQEEIKLVDAFIREKKLHSIGASGKVINTARRLALETEGCICSFLSKQPHSRDRMKNMPLLLFTTKIKQLRKELEKIRGEFSGLNDKGSTISPKKPEDPHLNEGELFGMDVPYEELLELLGCAVRVNGEPTPKAGMQKPKVISIVGFGGSGKTRLAKQVYAKAGEQFFRWKAWVRMEDRSAKEVREEILKIISDKTSTGVQHVHKGVGTCTGVQDVDNGANQRYLMVIDDVRSTDYKELETLMEALPNSDVGSRIIVTTTSQSAADRCSSTDGHVYKMSTLSDVDSLKLFSKAYGQQLSDPQKKELSTLLKTCDGLPLALIDSAQFLKGKKVEWRGCQEAIRKLRVPEGTNGTLTGMQWVLINKYSGLASNGARACLLYFHMFPFENPTKRKFLIRRWLAEGLLQKKGLPCSDIDVAYNYLQTFSNGNSIRSMQVSNNATVKSCRLPGMMQQFISCQSESQDFVTFLRRAEEPPEPTYVRRLSLHDGPADSEACIEGVYVPLLRTLAVSGKACKTIMDFPQYKVLRVLDLKEWDYQDEIRGICQSKCKGVCKGKCKLDKEKKLRDILKGVWNLDLLKYLGLPASIGMVPVAIEKLKELETLDVGETENIVEVYREVIKLPGLKHLLGRFDLIEEPEKCVPKDSKLDTLSGFVTNGKAAFPKLMEHMRRLRKVKMWCDFHQSKKHKKEVKDVSTAIEKFIDGKNYILDVGRSLSIDVTGCMVQFLESLKAPCKDARLTKLKLHGRLHKVPGFITGLENINELCLSSTMLSKEFLASLAPDALPSLRYLKLVEKHLKGLKILPQHFKHLERICLVGKESLQKITIEAGALQHLDSLHVMCKALDGLAGIQIGHLERLKEITLDSRVTEDKTKAVWKDEAKGHVNKPCVYFIEADPQG